MAVDRVLILRKIKEYKKFRSDAEFARYIGISAGNLSKWYERNTFNIDKLSLSFPEISPNWLLTGSGEMLQKPKNSFDQLTEEEIEEVSTQGIADVLMRLYNNGVFYPAGVHNKIIAEKNEEITKRDELILRLRHENWELQKKLEEKN